MTRSYTLVYWNNEGRYVGKIRELPVVYSEAETLEELVVKLQTTYRQLMASLPEPKSLRNVQTRPITLTVE